MKVGQAGGPFSEFPQQKKVKEKPASAAAAAKGPGAKEEPRFAESFLNVAESSVKAGLNELMAGLLPER